MSTDEIHDEPTRVEGRLIDAHCSLLRDEEPRNAVYNHSVLCQTSLPYRNPGDDNRVWQQKNGKVTLQIQAGYAVDQDSNLIPVGLPYGPRARLVLIHIMTQAVLTQTPQVELDDSLTAFAIRILGQSAANGGRSIRTLRDQLRRLSGCSMRFVQPNPMGGSDVVQSHLVEALQVFAPTNPRQRVLWPSTVTLASPFFDSLINHAVPLDPRALGALKHSAAALDCYQWLAQRIYRCSPRGQLIRWATLHNQLGGNTRALWSWKQAFLGKGRRAGVLPQVLYVYPEAVKAIDITSEGLIVRQGAPPISPWSKVQQRRLS